MRPWDEVQIEQGSIMNWKFGSLSLWIEHRNEEYLISHVYTEEDTKGASVIQVRDQKDVPEDLLWNRYIVQDTSAKFQLVPALPNRAVVVSPEFPIKLAPKSGTVFYMSIPLWVQIMTGTKKKTLLMEIPSQILSNTWFGDALTGELCYALTTRARREVAETAEMEHRIICPVHVWNSGTDPLDFQKLCVHVEHLRVYGGTRHLWSNEVSITYMGEEHPSEIRYEERMPKNEKECQVLSMEREPAQKNIISKSFSFFKSITTFDER
jgi:hypothetical protein